MTQKEKYYYSFVDVTHNKNIKPKSYQLQLRYDESILKGKRPDPLTQDDLDELFIHTLFAIDVNNIEIFLDYHLHEYQNNQGRRINFISHTKKILYDYTTHLELRSKVPIFSPYQLPVIPANEEMKRRIFSWLKENEDTPGSKKNNPKQIYSYKWKNNPEKELPVLYKGMKGKFITDETEQKDFISIFSGVLINEIQTPVLLKKEMSNKLLAYFLNQLEHLRYIEKCNWQSIAGKGKLFINYKAKTLTSNDLSVASSENKKYTPPKGHKEIDVILNEIKNLKNIQTS